jgi:hypothetical protein
MNSGQPKDWIGWVVGGILLIAGVTGLLFCPKEVGIRLSEAFFIAGVLTITVDPFLKRRLLKEASTDIFHHLLGFDLPSEIRETLKEFLLQNRYYRKNVDIEAHAQTSSDGMVEVTWSVRGEVVAVATTEYRQHVSFEEAEQGRILQASVTSTLHPGLNYTDNSPSLTPVEGEPMVTEWSGKIVKLKKGDQLNSFVKFVTRGQRTGFAVTNFGNSTISPRVRVSCSNDLEISASASDQRNGAEYIYRKVFVRGDHFQVRWKPKAIA